MKKNLIISHIADMDGLGCVVLTNLVFPNVEVRLIEPRELNGVITELLKDNMYNNYERIFITDLGMDIETGNLINNSEIKNILLHFDHHETNMEVNKFNFSTVIPKVGNFLPSGTSLYYDYLIKTYPDNNILNKNSVKEVVEGIRSYDTYQFKETNDLTGYKLTSILSVIGKDEMISTLTDRLRYDNTEHFNFSKKELDIYEKCEKEVNDYLKWCDEKLIRMNFLGYDIGLSISTKYRSSVGNVLSEKYKDELAFILIANYDRESFSIRTVNDINVGKICQDLGGGGHDKAGGFPMNDDNLKLTSPFFNKEMLEKLKKKGF